MLLAQQQQQRRVVQRNTTTITTTTSSGGAGSKAWWCCSMVAVLKWLELIFAVVIVAVMGPILCISPGQYDFIIFAAAFCLCVVALTLVIYFLRMHKGPLKALPWCKVEFVFNVLAVFLYAAATGIGIYHCTKLFDGAYREMAKNEVCAFGRFYESGRDSFREEWRGRIAAATVFCVLNTALHVTSAIYARNVLF